MRLVHRRVWDKAFSEARDEILIFTDAWTEAIESADTPGHDPADSTASLAAQLQALQSFCAEIAAKVVHSIALMCLPAIMPAYSSAYLAST